LPARKRQNLSRLAEYLFPVRSQGDNARWRETLRREPLNRIEIRDGKLSPENVEPALTNREKNFPDRGTDCEGKSYVRLSLNAA
jgi:hypothetical protein